MVKLRREAQPQVRQSWQVAAVNKILTGDCRDVLKGMDAASVHCCVTSPPYYRLRSYLPDSHPMKAKEMGSETRFDCAGWATGDRCGKCFICELVNVFREVRRVLVPDGVAWINIADSYAAATVAGTAVKPKDLHGAPWRLAMALQADGWWWRDNVVWHKPNPMPSSVDDRCTPAWEPMLMMTPSAKYFFDWRAIATKAASDSGSWKMADGWDTGPGSHGSIHRDGREKGRNARDSLKRPTKETLIPGQSATQHREDREESQYDTSLARKRNVWSIPTASFSEAHYATFPSALVEPCILSSTSAAGHCPDCGKRWTRQRTDTGERREVELYTGKGQKEYEASGVQNPSDTKRRVLESMSKVYAEKFVPQCECGSKPAPDVVLDIFGGSGTTGLVADRLHRDAVLIELGEANVAMSKRRIQGDAPLFSEVRA